MFIRVVTGNRYFEPHGSSLRITIWSEGRVDAANVLPLPRTGSRFFDDLDN